MLFGKKNFAVKCIAYGLGSGLIFSEVLSSLNFLLGRMKEVRECRRVSVEAGILFSRFGLMPALMLLRWHHFQVS